MVNLFRHLKHCAHRAEGRKHRSCHCPLMVEGTLRGVMIRKALDIRSWDADQAMIREWGATGLGAQAPNVAEAVEALLKDAVARNVVRR